MVPKPSLTKKHIEKLHFKCFLAWGELRPQMQLFGAGCHPKAVCFWKSNVFLANATFVVRSGTQKVAFAKNTFKDSTCVNTLSKCNFFGQGWPLKVAFALHFGPLGANLATKMQEPDTQFRPFLIPWDQLGHQNVRIWHEISYILDSFGPTWPLKCKNLT